MSSYALSLVLCSLGVLLPFGAAAQSTGAPAGQVVDLPCENTFGSTPETYGKLVTPPTVVHRVVPQYPLDARRAHIEGTVVLCITIGKDGHVRSVGPSSGPKELIPPAVKALERWRFRPFLANGQPVEASTQIVVNFRLTGIQIMVARARRPHYPA